MLRVETVLESRSVTSVRAELVEETLSDGSKAHNVRLIIDTDLHKIGPKIG